MNIVAKLTFHPLADIFPLLEGEAFDELVANIQRHGLLDTIIVLDGQVLDGRNRYRACLKAGVKPRVTPWNGEGSDPLSFVVSRNLHRRHLSESQRGMVAAKIANMEHGGERGNQYTSGKSPIGNLPKVSRTAAAKQLNVGTSTVGRATKLLKHGTKEQIAAVEAGTLKLNAAEKAINAQMKKKPEPPAKDTPAKDTPRDYPIRLPPNTTAEELCRKGLAMEATVKSKATVARKLGIDPTTYKRLREIVLLNDHADLSATDRALAQDALAHVNKTRFLRRSYETIAPISAKVWGTQKNNPRDDKKAKARIERFQIVMHGVHQACISASELEVPYLPGAEVEKAVKMISKATGALRRLLKNLEELSR